jgi:hypothetical protein
MVPAFERSFAERLGTRFAVACSSGTPVTSLADSGAGAALVEVDAVGSEQAEPSSASSAAAPVAEIFFIEPPR